MIQVENLHKSFAGVEVLRKVKRILSLGKVARVRPYFSSHY